MKMRSKTPYEVFIAALLLLITLAVVPLVMADQKQDSVASGNEHAVPLPMDKVTIDKKTITAVITNIGERYAISGETIIVGLDGQQVSIRKMLVPCEATVTYSTYQGIRTAQRITVTHISAKAGWHWIGEIAE